MNKNISIKRQGMKNSYFSSKDPHCASNYDER